MIAENYAAVGKTRGLTTEDVNNPAMKDFVANVEMPDERPAVSSAKKPPY